MPVSVKVGGVWKTATNVYNKVGGVWKTAADMPVKVGGVWKTGVLIQGAYESIATINASGATNVTFTGIPSTYKSLQIRFSNRNNEASGDVLYLQFNNDAGSNYSYHAIQTTGTSITVGQGFGADTIRLIGTANATSNRYAGSIIDIVDYAATDKPKTVRSLAAVSATATSNAVYITSGAWLSNSAITSIKVASVNSYTFASQVRISLYGIKG